MLLRFELNEAEFGGALQIVVDEAVDLSSGPYSVHDATFLSNHGSDGGAIWIASTSSADGYFRFNAHQVKVQLQDLILKENR